MLRALFLNMLNREAASPASRSAEIFDHLPLAVGDVVADIGSGGGYFTLELARRVGDTGRVYAVDTKADTLAFVEKLARREGLEHVVPVPVTGGAPDLPEADLDLIFSRNAFHHLPAPAIYFGALKRSLKPDGRVVIIDHKPKGGRGFVRGLGHATPVDTIIQAMADAGYVLTASLDVLPEQSFLFFELA